MTGTKQIAGRGQTVHTVPMAARPGWKNANHNRQQDTQGSAETSGAPLHMQQLQVPVNSRLSSPSEADPAGGGGASLQRDTIKKGGVRISESQTVEEAAEVEETR